MPPSSKVRQLFCFASIAYLNLVSIPNASAEPTPPVESPETSRAAQDYFQRGEEAFSSSHPDTALRYFERSYEESPTAAALYNIALTLERLGRIDEALERYQRCRDEHERALATRGVLSDVDRALRELAPRVADLHLIFEGPTPGSEIVEVDGARRDASATKKIRLLPGRHEVRVSRAGFLPVTTILEVQAGRRYEHVFSLRPVGGWLQVGGTRGDVWLDGARVGAVPYEGACTPGGHVIQIVDGDEGSWPSTVDVKQGDISVVRLALLPLALPLTIETTPAEARLYVGDTEVGIGSWTGRLPAGPVVLRVSATGYVSTTIERTLTTQSSTEPLRINLQRDENHPMWPRAQRFTLGVEGTLGFALSGGLNSGVESNCSTRCSTSIGWGGAVDARAVVQFPNGAHAALGLGAVGLAMTTRRTLLAGAHRYEIEDPFRLSGAYVSVGAGWVFRAGPLHVLPRVAVAPALFRVHDATRAVAIEGSEVASVSVLGDSQSTSGTALLLLPEILVETHHDKWRFFTSMGAMALLTNGPSLGHDELAVDVANVDCTTSKSVRCVKGDARINGERAWAPSIMGVVRLGVGRAF